MRRITAIAALHLTALSVAVTPAAADDIYTYTAVTESATADTGMPAAATTEPMPVADTGAPADAATEMPIADAGAPADAVAQPMPADVAPPIPPPAFPLDNEAPLPAEPSIPKIDAAEANKPWPISPPLQLSGPVLEPCEPKASSVVGPVTKLLEPLKSLTTLSYKGTETKTTLYEGNLMILVFLRQIHHQYLSGGAPNVVRVTRIESFEQRLSYLWDQEECAYVHLTDQFTDDSQEARRQVFLTGRKVDSSLFSHGLHRTWNADGTIQSELQDQLNYETSYVTDPNSPNAGRLYLKQFEHWFADSGIVWKEQWRDEVLFNVPVPGKVTIYRIDLAGQGDIGLIEDQQPVEIVINDTGLEDMSGRQP